MSILEVSLFFISSFTGFNDWSYSTYFLYSQILIFRFIEKQNNKDLGLTSIAVSRRRNRNLVSIKINLINWILQTVATALPVILSNNLGISLYIIIVSTGTPLIYYFGIEENRVHAINNIKSKIDVVKEKQKDSDKTGSKQVQDRYKTGTRQGQDRDITGIWQGQDRDMTGTRQGQAKH